MVVSISSRPRTRRQIVASASRRDVLISGLFFLINSFIVHWNLHATQLLLAHAGSLVNYRIEWHAIGFRCLMGTVWKLFLRESFVNISTIFTSAKFDASSEVWQRSNSSRTQLFPSKISTNRVKLARIKNCFYECFSHFTSRSMRTSIRVTRYREETNAKLHIFSRTQQWNYSINLQFECETSWRNFSADLCAIGSVGCRADIRWSGCLLTVHWQLQSWNNKKLVQV